MKILAYFEETPLCTVALRVAARLAHRLDVPLTVMTTRASTVLTEPEPPLGRDVPRDEWPALPPGLGILTRALAELVRLLGFSFSLQLSSL